MRLETMVGFEDKLNEVLASAVEGFRGLTSAERLSGGASQETYRVVVETDRGEEQLALRRAAGGGYDTAAPGRPGRPRRQSDYVGREPNGERNPQRRIRHPRSQLEKQSG